ncbi:MAG: hypothetical protein WD316_08445 [Phycisphaeraceae bacterium]
MNASWQKHASGLNISGVLPHTAVKAEHLPRRSETGIGAIMPWADRLWFVTYVAHKMGTGAGTGLFHLDDAMTLTKHPASVVGTYANRLIHAPSNQLIIGPHAIDIEGTVRTFTDLVNTRLTATTLHLSEPDRLVYFLGMEGELFEADVYTLEVRQLADLTEELGTSGQKDAHFKDACCAQGRLIVANNSYYAKDFDDPSQCDGRLAEWDGETWQVLERTQFNTVEGRVSGELGPAIFAVGQDRASAILKTRLPETGWMTYRFPKATHTQTHAWTTEWPRIREVESERWLMNASGMFYELPAMTYVGRVWGLRPISTHLRIIGDFASWNGLLVMAGDQTTPIHDSNPVVGQPQANLWFGKTDDLWGFGKPTGWGGPWWRTPVHAGEPSDPYLMTGFEHKCLHVTHDAGEGVNIVVEIDYMGDGSFVPGLMLTTGPAGYGQYVFPTGFGAHWVRLRADQAGTVTAQLHYT